MTKKKFYYTCICFLMLIGIISIFFLREEKVINVLAPEIDPKIVELERDDQYADTSIKIMAETVDNGYDIFKPLSGSSGYRYGPSIIYYEDGSMDAWYASPGNNSSEWDWISYRHYDGKIWSKEKIVLQPNGGSLDVYSTCDPGVIFFNGYYYLGYTSTIYSTDGGINNNIFVARSINPDGPFEKWNGESWGGDPWPLIHFEEKNTNWGAGEPSFLIADDRLYIYYSWNCKEGFSLRLSTAQLVDNWPAMLHYEGTVEGKNGDSIDVCFDEEHHKFIALNIEGFMSDNSGIKIMESDDGINYRRSGVIRSGISQYAHSCGIAKQKDGHIELDKDLLIGYAYGTNWGQWALHVQNIRLSAYLGQRRPFSSESNVIRDPRDHEGGSSYLSGISVAPRVIDADMSDHYVDIPVYGYSRYRHTVDIDEAELSFSDYDENIITISKGRIVPKNPGISSVTVSYGDKYTTFKVVVHDKDYAYEKFPEVLSISSLNTERTWYMEDEGTSHEIQIRTYMEFEDGRVSEGYNDLSSDHPSYPVKADGAVYHFEYESANEDILTVSDSGDVYLHRPGKTTITVRLKELSYEIEVTVNRRRLD